MDLDRTQNFFKKALKMAPYLLLYGVAFFVVGLFNFLTATYVTNFLNDALFWNRFLSQTIANILVFSGAVMQFLENRHDNEDYHQLYETVESAAINDLEADFGEWVLEENRELKIRAYQNEIQNKIVKQERKAKPQDLELWYTKPKSHWTEEEVEELAIRKKMNKYCRDRQYLLDSITYERLENVIMGMKVDYDRIDQKFVQSGYTSDTTKQNQQRDTNKRKVLENAHRVVFMIGSAAFFNGFIYDASIKNPVFWLQLTQSIFFLVYMFINGRAYAMGYIERILKVDLNTRFNIIKKYLTNKIKRKHV